MWLRRAAIICCFLAGFLSLAVAIQLFVLDGTLFVVLGDDAMISMRYAWHWAHGFGPYWNAGGSPEGYTNFLLVVLMAGIHALAAALRIPAPAISGLVLALNLAAGVVSMLLLGRTARRLSGRAAAGDVAMLLMAISAQFLLWGVQGFETSLLVLFSSAGLNALAGGRLVSCSLYWALGVLTRDDFALLVLVGTIAYACAAGGTRAARARWALALALAPLLAFLGHLAFRQAYYGDVLPNTYYLKATGWPLTARLDAGLHHVAGMLPVYFLVWLLLSRFLRTTAAERVRAVTLVAGWSAAAYLPYVIWVAGDGFPGSRPFAPVWPTLPLAGALGLTLLTRKGLLRIAAGLVLTLSPFDPWTAAVYSHVLQSYQRLLFHGLARYHSGGEPVSLPDGARNVLLCRLVEEDASRRGAERSLAGFYAGVAPYFCPQFRAIDLLGKSDAHIARLPVALPGATGHNKYDYDYSLGHHRPSYLLSMVPSVAALHDPAYLYQPAGGYNWHYLARSRVFIDLYADNQLPDVEPLIFYRRP